MHIVWIWVEMEQDKQQSSSLLCVGFFLQQKCQMCGARMRLLLFSIWVIVDEPK